MMYDEEQHHKNNQLIQMELILTNPRVIYWNCGILLQNAVTDLDGSILVQRICNKHERNLIRFW